MLVMFSVFSILFYVDGTTGYRKKNFAYFVHSTFEKATNHFSEMNSDGELTQQEWNEFASEQTVNFGEDPSILPVDLKLPMPWPEILIDYNEVKSLQHNLLWQTYSGEKRLDEKPPEKVYDASTIQEQITVFYICLSLSLLSMFFLIRTSRRRIIANDSSIFTAQARQIPYESMKTLDLRKWDTKGIAVIGYELPNNGGSARARIDGLTYGGFKKDQDEPAERLIRKIKAHFSGEVIEYAAVEEEPPENSKNHPKTSV